MRDTSQRDPRYDVLFEPIAIGPHIAKNRFYQVPHCNGMGVQYPKSMAAMRAMKAEGGWAVVCTEETEIHANTDLSPLHEGRLWEARDIGTYREMTDAVHAHGALAGIQLSHSGHRDAGLYSRQAPFSVTSHPAMAFNYPVQAQAMDLEDIRAYRKWHRDAALRAAEAGFDIVYVYCREASSLNGMFLSRQLNDRSDIYGGSLENRARLVREVLEDTKDAVGDRCAVAIRFTVDDARNPDGTLNQAESEDTIGLLAHVPDLWDVNRREWRLDSMPSRFGPEGHQEDLIRMVKPLVNVPVVGVGRFTSPDAMVSQIRRGVVDMIGAARPSIADPFLPSKIETGALDEIRECIGCNICASADATMVPLRCTQNPTMGEEWRRGWHPENVPDKGSEAQVLIVGSGPAGLEAALVLHKRGYTAVLAEKSDQFGGRVRREAKLPGLVEWGRVADHRMAQLQSSPNVSLFAQSDLGAAEVLEMGCAHVILAVGATWRADGIGRAHRRPVPTDESVAVLTPDDVMDGVEAAGPVVIFDDDHYYMGSLMAEVMRRAGHEVTLVTPASDVSDFSHATLDQGLIEARLKEMGVSLLEKHSLAEMREGQAICTHVADPASRKHLDCATVVMVTSRNPNTALYRELLARQDQWAGHGIATVKAIGDCVAPSTIAAAVYAGHGAARLLDAPEEEQQMRREFF